MNWLILSTAIIIIAAVAVKIIGRLRYTGIAEYHYKKKPALFTPAERSFLGVLDQAVGESCQIFGKVRVADVLTPEKGLSRSKWQRAFNRISGKHFDFLLCNKKNLAVICAVELDDKSHTSNNRQQRDVFLEGACSAAGIPLIRIPVKSAYMISEIKALFEAFLPVSLSLNKPKQAAITLNDRLCPKCASPMVKRIAKKGQNAGNEFWACSAFPKCKHTETTMTAMETDSSEASLKADDYFF